MPSPISALQRPDLGAIAFEYMLEASRRGFIGMEVLPVFDTPLKTADYPYIPLEAMLKIQETKRAPRGNYNRSDYKFGMKTYACEEYGWEELIDDQEAALYRRFFDAEEIAVMRAIDTIMRGHESRVASLVFNTGNITNTAGVSTEWDTSATCTPRSDVSTAKEALRLATGIIVDTMILSKVNFEVLLLAAEILDALKYTNPIEIGGIEAQKRVLATYFGVDRILVGNAIQDSAKKGQDAVLADLWDDEYCLLAKLSSGSQDLKEPALGRTFLWTEDSPDILVTETYREEQTRSDVVRVRNNVDEAFTFTGAGYLLSNIHT